MRTLGQALRNAIEIERAAARFYQHLVDRATDGQTRDFLEEMAAQEEAHARSLEAMAQKLADGGLPAHPDDRVESIETAIGWDRVDDEALDLRQSLIIAVEAENNAALYYDAMADFSAGEVAEFFRNLMTMEQSHAEAIRKKLEELG